VNWDLFHELLGLFCFGYPFAMAYYWMIGALLYRLVRERHQPLPSTLPVLDAYPPVSVVVPCFNEERQLEETFAALTRINYPDYEIIAINDGSRDGTQVKLDQLATQIPQLRVLHLAQNRGKSTALNCGAQAARHELLVCIDGDTLLDPNAVAWMVRRFQSDPQIGGLAGNPRIRNRSSIVGLLQVGEFCGTVGLIRRAQNVYGTLFTVSGAICAFRKRALQEAGWWDPAALTDDVDVSWRVQLAGWNIEFVPKAMAWILTPETLRGLWRQRLRWSEGGSDVVLRALPHLFSRRGLRVWPIWLNYVAAILWSYAILLLIAIGIVDFVSVGFNVELEGIGLIPGNWGMALATTYLLQMLVAALLDARLERHMLRTQFWVVWYPLAYWVLQAASAAVGIVRAALHFNRRAGTWVSPDRGFQ